MLWWNKGHPFYVFGEGGDDGNLRAGRAIWIATQVDILEDDFQYALKISKAPGGKPEIFQTRDDRATER